MEALTAGACLFFIAFAAARATRIPLTYDEAATYLRYISAPDFLSVFKFDVATNHFLNTLLTKIFFLAGGDRELVLRLPNLIGYGMYMWFSILILRRPSRLDSRKLPPIESSFRDQDGASKQCHLARRSLDSLRRSLASHRVIAFAGFMLLNLNPYLLDYFSLTRGYGLSLGFLMGMLFFFFTFLRQLHAGSTVTRDLLRALLFGCAAVMASFSLLNVYLAVFVVGLAALLVFNASTHARPATSASDQLTRRGRRSFPWLPLAATVFSLLVLSQDLGLSEKLYAPVEVRLVGLNEAELDAAIVSRVDVRGRATGLPFDAGASVWRTPPRAHVAGLRIELPAAAADKLAVVEVTAGSRRFRRLQGQDEGWASRDAGTTRVLESNPSLSLPRSRMPAYRSIINWTGDRQYVASLIGYTALGLLILGALAVLLKGAGWLAVRANLLSGDQWRPLMSGALWLTALAGWPLYMLRRESELYFGGTQGLIPDTFYSIIGSSFYDTTYYAEQTRAAFVVIVSTLAAFSVVLYLGYRRRKLDSVLPAVSLLAIMVVSSAASVAERVLFQTPYPLGRTALFYIPLYVLFLTFSVDTIAELGRAGRIVATSLMALVLSCALYHFTATANVTFALDWWRDSGTKAMMGDLAQVVAAERPPGSRVVLGVDRGYSAAAAFYAGKHKAANINIVVVPTPSDYIYVEDRNQGEAANVIKRYPVAGGLLARP